MLAKLLLMSSLENRRQTDTPKRAADVGVHLELAISGTVIAGDSEHLALQILNLAVHSYLMCMQGVWQKLERGFYVQPITRDVAWRTWAPSAAMVLEAAMLLGDQI